jgi:enterochelin esterase-like enzyme
VIAHLRAAGRRIGPWLERVGSASRGRLLLVLLMSQLACAAAAPVGSAPPAGGAQAQIREPSRERQPPDALPEHVGPLWGTFVRREFYSAALERSMPIYIYFPPEWATRGRPVPALLMLHGASGDHAEWATIQLIDWADQLIAEGAIPPLLVALPQGDFGYWVDHVDDGPRWGTYTARDVVGYLEANYPTLRRPEARAIGGLSQGGHGALQLGFNHPEVFHIIGAHSPSLREDDGFLPWLGRGEEFARRNPLHLAATLPLATLQRLTLWIDVGSDDTLWRPRAELLHQVLAERGVSHAFHVWPGGHDGEYWQPNVPRYLRYYGQALRARLGG